MTSINELTIIHGLLADIGFSNYEAKAYCALLQISPANGYNIAKESGVPRGKIYETLEKLLSRGAIVRVESIEKETKLFAPFDPDSVINNIKEKINSSCARALDSLKEFQKNPSSVEILWRVTSQHDLIARGRKLAENTRKTLHVALWAEEFDALSDLFIKAARKNIKIALVLYSRHERLQELQQLNTGSILHSRSKKQSVAILGRQFVLVADMKECITGSIFSEENVEGVYTLNRGLVTNAVDLVNHEIYLERILKRVGKPITDFFGHNLERLDAFDSID